MSNFKNSDIVSIKKIIFNLIIYLERKYSKKFGKLSTPLRSLLEIKLLHLPIYLPVNYRFPPLLKSSTCSSEVRNVEGSTAQNYVL